MNQMSKTVDIEEMAFLWNEKGMSAGQIGAEMGLSRCSVSGHINRNRSLFEVRQKAPVYARFKGVAPADRKPPEPRQPKEPKEAKPRNRRVNIQSIHKARQEAAEREAEDIRAGTSPLLQIESSDADRLEMGRCKELMDLEPGDCRWVLNNGGPYLFCSEAAGDEIYCGHHARRAYRPLEKR